LTVLLRKMTLKSAFTYGRHEGKTVQQLLDLHDTPYLRWAYFNIKSITFIDEILDLIHIYPDYRIEKPGVDKGKEQELYTKLFGLRGKHNPVGMLGVGSNAKKKINKKINKKLITLEQQSNNRGYLMRKNHGH